MRHATLWALVPFALFVPALAAVGCGSGASNQGLEEPECNHCHGSEENPAPPRSTKGETATTDITVGAHQTHLHDSEVRQAMWCQECHLVPTTITEPTHRDGSPAELTFGILSTTNGAEASWDRENETCSDVYCHGATLAGGANTEPVWTQVDGSQAFCGSCHGIPPLVPHPPNYECVKCHPDTMDDEGGIDLAAETHINGTVDVVDKVCNLCHGNDDNFAPPKSTSGETDTGMVTVGAHQSHLVDGELRRAVACTECHLVPEKVGDVGHLDSASPAELTFGTLATTNGVSPEWDRNKETCSKTYCHGGTLSAGTITEPKWTDLSGDQIECGTCHGLPPSDSHPQNVTKCWDCHPDTVDSDLKINIDKHIDGVVQVEITGECDQCHGAPPATGAHVVHFGATAADASYGGTKVTADIMPAAKVYAMDCGNCHPTDKNHHGNGLQNAGGGQAEIDLSPAGAPMGSVKSMNLVTASYTPGDTVLVDANGFSYTEGTCSDVYCHSEKTVATPNPVPLPGTDFQFAGYPISYPAYSVNIDRQYSSPKWNDTLSCDGCHGFPPRTSYPTVLAGAGDSHSWIDEYGYDNLHGWNHGRDAVACATCHFNTVIEQGVRTKTSVPPADEWSVYEKVDMDGHAAHVNGKPDVAFTTAVLTYPPPANYPPSDIQHDLTTASYDAQSKTCSNVSCHFLQTSVVWGTPFRWENSFECNVCHQF